MKKDVSTVVAEAVKEEFFNYFKLAAKYLLLILLFILFIFNFRASQDIHPLYFKFITEDVNSAVDLTKKTRTLPEGSYIANMQANIYGQEFANELLADRTIIDERISAYKILLEKNPNASDVLYNLYVLHKLNDYPEADEYLHNAQTIDPAIKE